MERWKIINKEIRDITRLLREGKYWEEIGEYLESVGYKKVYYDDPQETWYENENKRIEIIIVNDLEVRIYCYCRDTNGIVYWNNRAEMTIERDGDEVFTWFGHQF